MNIIIPAQFAQLNIREKMVKKKKRIKMVYLKIILVIQAIGHSRPCIKVILPGVRGVLPYVAYCFYKMVIKDINARH